MGGDEGGRFYFPNSRKLIRFPLFKMPTPANPKLYKKAKAIADKIYTKHSAYKSGFIVKKYKELGGTYIEDGEKRRLSRWFEEEWEDIGGKEYPVYRPTKIVDEDTPLTKDEIDPKDLKEKIKQKQKIKGKKNLSPFKAKRSVRKSPGRSPRRSPRRSPKK